MPHTHSIRPWLAGAALLTSLLVACGATAPTNPSAAGAARPAGGHGHAAFMGSYDINRDGVVTRDEYDTVRKQRFMAADTNSDGWLSEAEYVAEFEARLKAQYAAGTQASDEDHVRSIRQARVRFGILDTNKDGKLSIQEELAIADKTFKGADTNTDGKVDAADGKKP